MGLFLDILAGFFIVGMGAAGFNRGIVEELGRLLGLIFAAIIGLTFYIDVAGIILSVIALDPWIALLFAYAFLFGISLLVTRFITHLIHYLIVSGSTQWMNRGLGFLFGALKGLIIVIVFVWLVDISPMKKWSDIFHRHSYLVQETAKIRYRVIDFFGWSDPVKTGEEYMNSLMTKGILPEKNI